MQKRIAAFLLCLMLSVSICATASADLLSGEPDKQHKLWNLPFTSNHILIRDLLTDNRGIVCEQDYKPKTRYLPAYYTLESVNDDELSLYGYHYHFRYTSEPIVFKLRISLSNSSWADRSEACSCILNHLIDKYGSPDHATVELYSHGLINFATKSCVCSHEIIEIPINSAYDFRPDTFLESWPDTVDETELILRTVNGNMRFECFFNSIQDDHGYIEITFMKSSTSIYAPVRETCDTPKATPEPSDPNGF